MAARAGFAFADSFTLPPSRFRRFLPKRMGVITTTTTRKRKKVFNQPDIKINQNGLPKRFSEDS
jgi:hypothetical protein